MICLVIIWKEHTFVKIEFLATIVPTKTSLKLIKNEDLFEQKEFRKYNNGFDLYFEWYRANKINLEHLRLLQIVSSKILVKTIKWPIEY